MDKVKSVNDGMELPPLRGLNDFLLSSSRFQLPNFRDFEKWGNRVVNNLIYYQTNYLLTSIAIVLVTACLNPLKMFVGVLVMTMLLGVYSLEAMSIFQQYPAGRIIMVVISAGFVVYTINSILLLLFSILLSFCVTFVHASLRLRNIKNRIANKIEGLGLEHTPMGVFLKYFEQDLRCTKENYAKSKEDMIGITLRTQTSMQLLHK